jgi:hypothetical protein
MGHLFMDAWGGSYLLAGLARALHSHVESFKELA